MPEYVREAIARLSAAGHVAYVVGGCVRDFLLGREMKDYDIATSSDPDELCELFPDAVTVGKAFGVLKIPLRGREGARAEFLEIATFRQESDYKDHRHPSKVVFSGPLEDASRRDFTINALFYDPKTSRILDCFEGMKDLKSRILRAIGTPSDRFREDALRLLRAVRFSATLDFEIEPETARAVVSRSRLIEKVSWERIRDELQGMLLGPRPALAFRRLHELSLLSHVLPEVERARKDKPDEYKRVLRVLDVLAGTTPRPPVEVAWAALFGIVQDPDGACERLRLSRAQGGEIARMIEDLPKYRSVFQMRESTLRRFLREPAFAPGLELHRAFAVAGDGDLARYEYWRGLLAEARAAGASSGSGMNGKLLSGEDLIQLGFKPGPRFAAILREVEDLALERRLTSKEQALEYVIRNFA